MRRSCDTPRGKKRRCFSRKAAGALARSSSERGEIVDLGRAEILARRDLGALLDPLADPLASLRASIEASRLDFWPS